MRECEPIRADLVELMYGMLEPERKAQITEHLGSCEDCRTLLEEFNGVGAALDRAELAVPAAPSRAAMVPRSVAVAATLLVAVVGTTAGHWVGRGQAPVRVRVVQRQPDGAALAGKLAQLHDGLEPGQRAVLRAVEQVLAANTSLAGPLASLHRGEALLENGETDEVVEQADRLRQRVATSPLAGPAGALVVRARRQRARAHHAAGEYAAALRALADLTGPLRDQLEQNAGDDFRTLRLSRSGAVQTLLREYPRSAIAVEAFERRVRVIMPGLAWRARVSELELFATRQGDDHPLLSRFARLQAGQLMLAHPKQLSTRERVAARRSLRYAAQGGGKLAELARELISQVGG